MPVVQVCEIKNCTHIVDLGLNSVGRHMQMVALGIGSRYGLDLCQTVENEPLVEFNDLSSWVDDHGRGQFTGGRYYISTLLEGENSGRGLNLNGGSPGWYLDPHQYATALAALKKLFPSEG